jgi:hypothetical protein
MKRLAILTIVCLSACAQPALGPAVPAQPGALTRVSPQLAPPKCKNQKDEKADASATETLGDKAASMCVPEFGDFGGSIGYGPASPSIKVTLTTSTTDYNGKLPDLGTGSPILYVQLLYHGATTFGPNAPEVVFEGKYKPGKPYTEYGELLNSGGVDPCYAKATKGKYGGQLDLGNGIANTKVSTNDILLVEIYSGKHADSEC